MTGVDVSPLQRIVNVGWGGGSKLILIFISTVNVNPDLEHGGASSPKIGARLQDIEAVPGIFEFGVSFQRKIGGGTVPIHPIVTSQMLGLILWGGFASFNRIGLVGDLNFPPRLIDPTQTFPGQDAKSYNYFSDAAIINIVEWRKLIHSGNTATFKVKINSGSFPAFPSSLNIGSGYAEKRLDYTPDIDSGFIVGADNGDGAVGAGNDLGMTLIYTFNFITKLLTHSPPSFP